MESPTNDGTDLDGCRALNTSFHPNNTSTGSGAAQRRSSKAASSIKFTAAKRIGLLLACIAGLLLLSSSLLAPVDASELPSSASGNKFGHTTVDVEGSGGTENDRFIGSQRNGEAPASAPRNVDDFHHLDAHAVMHWVKSKSVIRDGETAAFFDRLYEELASSRSALNSAADKKNKASSNGQLRFWKRATSGESCSSSSEELSKGQKAIYGILIPILVVLSGLFAGLTLGYMSLDETQLQVLSLQGTPQQKKYAEKIMPIRKDGHLLLTTLLVANMITNETLPIIADPLLGGGVQAVIVSIVLVVIFAELIPQSVCSRYGLAIGAKLAPLTRVVILLLWPIAFPVSRVLHWTLGPHHGIVYRRAELKELVNMHAATAGRGDLNNDTVTIVGGALDLQEKVVKQAMTPIDQVFMISIESKLGYETLQQIVSSGHSRIPVYQEIEISVSKARGGSGAGTGTVTPTRAGGFFGALGRKTSGTHTNASVLSAQSDDQKTLDGGVLNATMTNATAGADGAKDPGMTTIKRKKIIGALLVKQCVLLDPEDETPVRDMVINALPTVPADEPLLNLLNVFQEGRSHLAIVSSRTRRFSPGSFVDLGGEKDPRKLQTAGSGMARSGTAAKIQGLGDIDEEKQLSSHEIKKSSFWSRHLRRSHAKSESNDLPPEAAEADVDASAVATQMAQRDVPIGIITLEDVLEELIGEEILDEYDSEVEQNFANISPPPSPGHKELVDKNVEAPNHADTLHLPSPTVKLPMSPKIPLPRFKLGRSNSTKAIEEAPGYFDSEKTPTTQHQQPSIVAALPTPAGESGKALAVADVTELTADQTSEQASRDKPVSGTLDEQTSNDASTNAVPTTVSRAGSRPASPGPGAGLGGEGPGPALVAPRANKPIVIRHQAADGTVSTAIVGEGLLRGRTATLSNERSGDNSRSNTPSGTRVSRFKSTPLPGISVLGSGAAAGTTGASAAGSAAAPRGNKAVGRIDPSSTTLTEEHPQLASPEAMEDDENKQLETHDKTLAGIFVPKLPSPVRRSVWECLLKSLRNTQGHATRRSFPTHCIPALYRHSRPQAGDPCGSVRRSSVSLAVESVRSGTTKAMPLYPAVEPSSSDFPRQPELDSLPNDELRGGPAPWKTGSSSATQKISSRVAEGQNVESVSDLEQEASPLVFGGGVFGHEMYNNSETLASDIPIRTVRLALRYGLNAFDTSPYYFPSEFTLGNILTRLRPEFPRSTYFLMTKCGRYGPDAKHFDYSPEKVDSSVRGSCRRLGTDYLDAALMHDTEFVCDKVGRSHDEGWSSGIVSDLVQPEAVGCSQTRQEVIDSLGLHNSTSAASKVHGPGDEQILAAVRTLFKLKDEGVIRRVGISGYPLPVLLRLSRLVATNAPYRPLDVILSYSNHCLHSDVLIGWKDLFAADPRGTDSSSLPDLQWKPPILMNGSPFSMGLLTDGGPPPWHPASEELKAATQEASRQLLAKGENLSLTALTYGLRGSELAQSTGEQPQLRTLVGLSHPDHVHSAVEAYRLLCAGAQSSSINSNNASASRALHPLIEPETKLEAYKRQTENEKLVRELYSRHGVREWSWSSGL
ncbi:DUF21-domain-containing protein [Testicularia cyperi]|uniref:DUF21-domain-containing protein n=1 Tax=Testicularia cyperi TaxID=1882483 RepID=A0A317XV90_9BASI|nr:DUF21-domain-containing protein [Testicularia cyperi]